MKIKGDSFQCKICNKQIIGDIGSITNLGNGQVIVKCKNCSRKSESLVSSPELIVVPVTPNSFEFILKNNKYYFPMSYNRRIPRYIAFYISDPVSAITHYATPLYLLKDVPLSDLIDLSQIKYSDEKLKFKVCVFDKLIELDNKVERGDSGGIQNVRNTTLKKLIKAKKLNEL